MSLCHSAHPQRGEEHFTPEVQRTTARQSRGAKGAHHLAGVCQHGMGLKKPQSASVLQCFLLGERAEGEQRGILLSEGETEAQCGIAAS